MYILGVHLDFPFLKLCRIRKTRKAIDIFWTKTVLLAEESRHPLSGKEELQIPPDSANEKNPYKTQKNEAIFEDSPQENVKRLYTSHFREKVVSGLAAKDFLIRSIDVKIASKNHVEEAISFQSEALSHFKPGEALIVPIVRAKEKGKAEGLLFTIPKDHLKAHLEELQKWGIDPDVVSTIPSALCHFVQWKFSKLDGAFIVDLGSSAITCALMEQRILKKAHAIPMGIEELLGALYEDRKRILLKNEIEGAAKQIDLLLLKSHLNPRLSEKIGALRQELSKVYFSFTRNSIQPIIFTGRSDAFIHLREFLMDEAHEEWSLSLEEQKSAASIGLCLEQVSSLPLQLRRNEFFPKKNWAQMGFIGLSLLGLSLFLSAALVWIGFRFSDKIKGEMLRALPSSLLIDGKAEERIDRWIDDIEKNNKEYPYILQTPKVTEVLSWFSSHPLLEELKREGDPIDIREIRVQLVDFPSIHSPDESYLEKVEIEFRFKSIMNARRFHEALREGDDWINTQREISWDVLNESYRTSFYLKNRSPYAP